MENRHHQSPALTLGRPCPTAVVWAGPLPGFGKQGWVARRACAVLMLIESACWLGLCKAFPVAFITKCFMAPHIPPCWPLGLTFS